MKMKLHKVNPGSRPDERKYAEISSKYDNCDLIISDNEMVIRQNKQIVYHTELFLYEDDGLTTTYLGTWPDGETFRIVRPGRQVMELVRLLGQETITLGSMFPDGYAVSYLI